MVATTAPLVPLSAVPRLPWLPRRRGSGKLHVSTVYRWATRGVAGVTLPTVCVGASRCTTEEDLRHWFAAVAAARQAQAAPAAQSPQWSDRRRSAAEAASRRVEARLA